MERGSGACTWAWAVQCNYSFNPGLKCPMPIHVQTTIQHGIEMAVVKFPRIVLLATSTGGEVDAESLLGQAVHELQPFTIRPRLYHTSLAIRPSLY